MTYQLWIPDQVGHDVCVGMTCGTGMTMLFADPLSCKVQIINRIGLCFQQNLLKFNTNIVLYQVVFRTISAILYPLIFVLIFNYSGMF